MVTADMPVSVGNLKAALDALLASDALEGRVVEIVGRYMADQAYWIGSVDYDVSTGHVDITVDVESRKALGFDQISYEIDWSNTAYVLFCALQPGTYRIAVGDGASGPDVFGLSATKPTSSSHALPSVDTTIAANSDSTYDLDEAGYLVIGFMHGNAVIVGSCTVQLTIERVS